MEWKMNMSLRDIAITLGGPVVAVALVCTAAALYCCPVHAQTPPQVQACDGLESVADSMADAKANGVTKRKAREVINNTVSVYRPMYFDIVDMIWDHPNLPRDLLDKYAYQRCLQAVLTEKP
jgi:hypothetical protein